MGAVDWRKIVLAAVVSLLAVTNEMSVAAYEQPMIAVLHRHGSNPRRAGGNRTRSARAAIPERSPATASPCSAQALIAAPPVEKSAAAAMIRSWGTADDDIVPRDAPRPTGCSRDFGVAPAPRC